MNQEGHDLLREAVQLAQRLYEATDGQLKLAVLDHEDYVLPWPQAFELVERE